MIPTQEAITALRAVLQDAHDAQFYREERDTARADAAKWQKIAEDLGAGITVKPVSSRSRLEITTVIDEMVLLEMKDRRGYIEYVAGKVYSEFKAALQKRGLWP